tara:strand:+ start:28246 stop:29517 length:1272 start_codon:yes stop_codon:yes gene_type:complete
MATSYYSTGTITLTNGSAVVTGTGTAWSTALIASGNIFVQAPGNPLPIATVDSDTQITAELAWTGTTGTYSYQIQLDQGLTNSAQNATNLAYLLAEMRQGTIFKYDASGTLADRDLFDGRSKGFSYLVTGGESAILYVKATNTSGDWAGPYAYGTGPQGEQGPIGTLNPMGTYSAVTTYAANDNVLYNGSSWVALQATTGNAPPTLPTTENAYWSLLAVKGTDGTGIGDMLKSVYDPQNLQVDAFARDSHTGTQEIATVGGLQTALDSKVAASSGAIVGSAYTEFNTFFGGGDAIPSDDSIPQSNEGSGILSLNYTPKSASNRLRIRAVVQCSSDALRNVIAALFVGTGSSAVKTGYVVTPGAGYHINIVVEHELTAGTTGNVGIQVRSGAGSAGVCYFNGLPSGRLFGGTSSCTLTVEETKP